MRHLQAAGEARFVTGNIMRHVVVMTGTGAIGLMAVFAVDLLNLFYISLLGQRPIAAAVGIRRVVGLYVADDRRYERHGGAQHRRRRSTGGAPHCRGGLVLMVLAGFIVGLGTVALLGPIACSAPPVRRGALPRPS